MAWMRIIVAGGRDMVDEQFVHDTLDLEFGTFVEAGLVDCIISGGARGADSLGESWAKLRGVNLVRRPADWDQHGKAAGIIRNVEMITKDKATHTIAFWDGLSRGTKHMLEESMKRCLFVKRVKYGITG